MGAFSLAGGGTASARVGLSRVPAHRDHRTLTQTMSVGLVAGFVAATCVTAAAELRVTQMSKPASIPDTVVVGRAVCSASTSLLTESRQLVEVRNGGAVATVKVSGFAPSDRPWGLACLADGTLWTMATARTMARIDETGQIRRRIDVQLPRVALFAAGDRLLFQQLPIVQGTAALMTSPPQQPYAVRSWPGLVVQGARTRENELAQNLAICGVALGTSVPCWFIRAMQFTVSNGTASRTVDVPPLRSMPVDRETPIRDVALASSEYFWLLAGGPDAERGRTAGVRLFRLRERTSEALSLELKPAARIVLRATESQCLLLLVDGSVIEVAVTP